MKKLLVLFMSLMLMVSMAACGEKNGGESHFSGSAPIEAGNTPSNNTEKQEIKVYGIGEAAEVNGLAISIDKVEAYDLVNMLQRPRDGFEYMKVYYTFTNVADEAIKSPSRKDLYIVYEEGPTGDDCDMTSDNTDQVLPDVGDRNERYMSSVELASGQSAGGWMVYQRQADKSEITMHYYSGFINVPPDLVFSFTL